MNAEATTNSISDSVDVNRGWVKRHIFSGDRIYVQEMNAIFGRCWLFLGHETQIENPGDYVRTKAGETSVIVFRDKNNAVQAFVNSCRHRGNPVVTNDQGNTTAFTCRYHGWSYNACGRQAEPGGLVSAPGMTTYYHDKLDRNKWGLAKMAQVGTYKGLIFGTFDSAAPSLEEYLGDMRWALDLLLEQGDLAVAPGLLRWRIKCNWKFAADNAIGDTAHAQIAHRSALIAFNKLMGAPLIRLGEDVPGFTMMTRYGHGLNAQTAPGRQFPALEWWRSNPEAIRKMGEFRGKVARFNMNVFPNLFIIDRVLMVRNPIDPMTTEICAIALYDKNSPEDIQRQAQEAVFRKFGPSGFLEQEDGENWEQATVGAALAETWNHPLNYEMGLGRAEFVNDGNSPARVDSLTNEYAQLWFYHYWSQAAIGTSWSELAKMSPEESLVQARFEGVSK